MTTDHVLKLPTTYGHFMLNRCAGRGFSISLSYYTYDDNISLDDTGKHQMILQTIYHIGTPCITAQIAGKGLMIELLKDCDISKASKSLL